MERKEKLGDIPAGFKRDEEIKVREDEAAQEGEQLAAEAEVFAIDPRAFRIENEIAQHFNALEVSHADPNFRYCWVNAGGNGRYVQYKLARRYRGRPIWEVVRGDMPEAIEVRQTDGSRRIGDVILMRARRELAEALDRMAYERQKSVEGSMTTELEDLVEKARSYGANVWVGEEVPEHIMRRMHNKAQSRRTGTKIVDSWLRQGKMPGMVMEEN